MCRGTKHDGYTHQSTCIAGQKINYSVCQCGLSFEYQGKFMDLKEFLHVTTKEKA